MKRKFLASLLALCMMLTAVPGAWAAEGTGVECTEENCTHVAAIGATHYETLDAAISNAAASGDTIVLQKDIVVTGTIVFPADKEIELDLNGCSIEAKGSYSEVSYNIIFNKGTLTITDSGKVGEIATPGGYGTIAVDDQSTTTIRGGSFTSVEGAVTLGKATGATLNILDGEFSASDNAVIAGNGSPRTGEPNIINISGGTFTGKITSPGYVACGIYAPWKDDVTVTGGTFNITEGAGIVARAGNVVVEGGEFNTTGNTTGKVGDSRSVVPCAALVFDSAANYGAMTEESGISVVGGVFNSDANSVATVGDKSRIEVVGGTFSSDPSEFVTDDYRTVKENGQFVVKSFAEVAVAKIGGDYYETLEKAINAVQDEGKITLLRDTKENVTVPAGKTITLDLNGCTLNGGTGNNKPALTNSGIVTITDSKTGGTIKREDVNTGSGCHYVVDNQGEMTIEGGEIYNDSGAGKSGSSLIRNSRETNTAGATLNIVGGTFQQDDYIVIKNDDYGILNISGGTFNSKNDQVIQNWSIATITGGEMNGEVITWSWKEVSNNAKMTLSGGVVDGNVEAINYYYGDSYSECAPEVEISGEACVKGSLGTYAWKDGRRIATDTLAKLTVNGGHFVEDPSAYVANGLAALKSHKNGYTYEVRKPATYTVTFTTDHGTAPEQVVETENFADTVITLPAAPTVEGYTFLGWALDGRTYAAGEKYTVTKDVTFTAKWAENVDTPVVDEEVVILPSAPVVPQPDTAGKPQAEAEAMKDMAEALQQPGAVEVEGLTDAAKDEIRDAAAAADKNEAFQEIVKEAQEKDPTAEITTTIVLEPYMDIQVKDAQVDGDKIAVELELTPMVKAKATIDPQHMTEANTVVLYTQEMNVTETVTITLPLPDVFAGNTEDLYVKHETGKKTYYYDTTVVNGKVIFENPHGFSTFTLVTDDRYAEVQLGDLLCEFVPSDVGMSLDMEDAYDAPRGEYFVGWKFDGVSGVHDTLTDELLTKLAEKYNEDGEAVRAKPVFDEKSSGGSVDRGYAIRVEKTENGKVTAPSSATAGSTVTIKVKPDAGYQLDELVVTDKDGDELKLTDKGNGKFTFKMPKSKVTVEATFVEIDREPEAQELPFVDVADTAYYADAVRWAVAEGITGGTSAATFSPNAACTRAQAVTFLWRAAGSPVVNYAMGFTDVPADAYYAEAVRWAVSQGITTGATETTFAPDAPCTRAQIVTFIYRNVKAQGGGFTGSWMFPCPFTDVSADAYYFESVQWCVMNGITEGATETTFAPDATCTRAQIVTFLYRGAEK